MELKLYVVPGSHPCRTVEAALALKGLPYERIDLLPGLSQFAQLARFGKRTVPGLTADGNRVTGSLSILRYLDGLAPEPPLYPADPPAAAAAAEAERWGDEVLQTAARWITIHALTRRPEAAESFMGDANLPQLPSAVSVPISRVIFGLEARLIGGGTGPVERWLGELPALLDHCDALIADGVLGGEQPGAADLQIGASLWLLMSLADLRDAIAARPCGALAERLFRGYPGAVPAGALPAAWLPDLRVPATV